MCFVGIWQCKIESNCGLEEKKNTTKFKKEKQIRKIWGFVFNEMQKNIAKMEHS